MKIHHLGIITDSIEKSVNVYGKLGYTQMTNIVLDNIQHNRIVFLKNNDANQVIELVQPLDEQSSVKNFKNSYHHLCYDVREIPNFIEYFKTLKIGKIFTKPIIAPAINNCHIVFAYLNEGVFVEFIIL